MPPLVLRLIENSKGMGIRSNRYLMVIENLKIKNIQVEKETKLCGLS